MGFTLRALFIFNGLYILPTLLCGQSRESNALGKQSQQEFQIITFRFHSYNTCECLAILLRNFLEKDMRCTSFAVDDEADVAVAGSTHSLSASPVLGKMSTFNSFNKISYYIRNICTYGGQ